MLLLTGDLIFACKQTGIQSKSRYPRIKGCLVRQMGRGVAERLPVRRSGLQSQTGLAVDGAFEAVGVLEERFDSGKARGRKRTGLFPESALEVDCLP